jgi:hypothetical protein
MAIPSRYPSRPLIVAKYQIYCAVAPGGRIMQVWGTPPDNFPEVIATDYPDPDICTIQLLCATNNFTEADRTWRINADICRNHCDFLSVRCHTINPNLED